MVGWQASAGLPGASFPHLKSCGASPTHPMGPQTQKGLQPRWSQFGRDNWGKGRHRGQYDRVPQGPWRHGDKLQRVGLRTVSGLAEGWAGS